MLAGLEFGVLLPQPLEYARTVTLSHPLTACLRDVTFGRTEMVFTQIIFCGVYSLTQTGQRRLRNNFLGCSGCLFLGGRGTTRQMLPL